MKHIVVLITAVAALATATTPAIANVPNGDGLERIEGELPCVNGSGGIETSLVVVVTRGGGATGWRAEPQGQHHVLSYFAVTYHFDAGDVVDAKTWGNKTGIAALHCRQDYPAFGGFPAVTVEGTIHPLPGS